MSLDCNRQAADEAITSPCAIEYLTVTTITILVESWTGRAGDGVASYETIATLRYPTREVSKREVASSGGLYQAGDLIVSDVTKPYTGGLGGGYTEAQLRPASGFATTTQNKRVIYRADGDLAGDYALISLNAADVISWTLQLRRTRER